MRVNYHQLDDEALALLQSWLKTHDGNRAELARKLGVARSSISQAIDGKYPGDTRKLRAKIIDGLAAQILCPHQGVEIAPKICASLRGRPLSACSAHPGDVNHWRACRACAHNPNRTKPTEGGAS